MLLTLTTIHKAQLHLERLQGCTFHLLPTKTCKPSFATNVSVAYSLSYELLAQDEATRYAALSPDRARVVAEGTPRQHGL